MAGTLADLALAVGASIELSIIVKATIVLTIGLLVVQLARHARASVRHAVLSWTFAVHPSCRILITRRDHSQRALLGRQRLPVLPVGHKNPVDGRRWVKFREREHRLKAIGSRRQQDAHQRLALKRGPSYGDASPSENLRQRHALIIYACAPVLDLDALTVHGPEIVQRQRQCRLDLAVYDESRRLGVGQGGYQMKKRDRQPERR